MQRDYSHVRSSRSECNVFAGDDDTNNVNDDNNADGCGDNDVDGDDIDNNDNDTHNLCDNNNNDGGTSATAAAAAACDKQQRRGDDEFSSAHVFPNLNYHDIYIYVYKCKLDVIAIKHSSD